MSTVDQHNDAELRASIIQLFIKINNLIIKHGNSDRLAGKFGLSQQQWTLLSVLHRNGNGMTMTELGKNLLVTKANMTGMIDRLERDNFVSRHPDLHDRRVTKVMLTQKGLDFMEEIQEPRNQFTEENLADFSPEDRKKFVEYLELYFKRLDR
ncbi:MAG: MarR family winged helix-turn-helix transcriptional regulator [Tumebacillaceae bacterium]